MLDASLTKLYRELEFDKVLEGVLSFCQTLEGKKIIRELEISTDPDRIRALLEETLEAIDLMECGLVDGEIALINLPNDPSFLKPFSSGGMPEEEHLKSLWDFFLCDEQVFQLRERIFRSKYPELSRLLEDYTDLTVLRNSFKKTFTEEGEVRDSASHALRLTRNKLHTLQLEIEEKIHGLIHSRASSHTEDIHLSIRNNRLAMNIPTGMLSVFKGLIIDYSGSGMSVYVEPEEVVSLNNERQRLLLDEEQEVMRIIGEYAGRVGEHTRDILRNYKIIAQLDAIFAKAKFSDSIGGILPSLSEAGTIKLRAGRHPLMLPSFVPEDLDFGEETGLIISGVNAGGKTVLLKLIGVLTLMTYSGIFIPAEEGTEIGLFGKVLADVTDEQSVQNNLSTFTARIAFLNEVFEHLQTPIAERGTLILIDELEAGTDPDEGAGLGIAVLEHILERNAKVAVTTHHEAIKAFGVQNKSCKSVSLEFDEKELKPTYRVVDGIPGKSYAFDIARAYGIPESVIEAGSRKVKTGKTYFSEAIRVIKEEKLKLEDLRTKEELEIKRLEELRTKHEGAVQALNETRSEIRRKFENLKAEFSRNTEKFLACLRDEFRERLKKEMAKGSRGGVNKVARELLEEANASTSKLEEKYGILDELTGEGIKLLSIGDRIRAGTLGIEGEVLKVDDKKNEVVIMSSGKKVTLALTDVTTVLKVTRTRTVTPKVAKKHTANKETLTMGKQIDEGVRQARDTTPHRLDLHGLTKAEALEQLEKFISDAIYRNLDKIYVLHGIGTGTLKRFVADYLGKSEYVESFREATLEEGGKGVTVVDLK